VSDGGGTIRHCEPPLRA